MRMLRLSIGIFFVLLLSQRCYLLQANEIEKSKILYFTHEPGTYHRYTPQLAIFRQLAKRAGWELTVMTGDHESQIKKLHAPDYGKQFDAIVYNFCFAGSRDTEAAANLIAQTRENGVPALLIHCAMHSWWPTFKSGTPGSLGPDYQGKGKADAKLVTEWRLTHDERPFPVWGDFTGVASTTHGPSQPITMHRVGKHAATSRFPKKFLTGNTELYNNLYTLDEVVPLIRGVQGNETAIVMWACPQGKAEVIGLTVGHDVNDWTQKPYQDLLVDSVNYLAAKYRTPPADRSAERSDSQR